MSISATVLGSIYDIHLNFGKLEDVGIILKHLISSSMSAVRGNIMIT